MRRRPLPASVLQLPPTPDKDCGDDLRAARIFHAEHGHLCPPPDTIINGIDLYAAIRRMRAKYNARSPAHQEIADWNALGIIWHTTDPAFDVGLAACREYRAREGHLNPPPGHHENSVQLDRWLRLQAASHAASKLTDAQIQALTEIGAL